MKKITLLFVLIASTMTCFADNGDSYNALKSELTLPSITIGNNIYTNVIINVPSSNLISVGTSAQIVATSVSATCSQTFTSAMFNAIAVGMSISQVEQIIGCLYDSSSTQRTNYSIYYTWRISYMDTNNKYISMNISVTFDVTGNIVTSVTAIEGAEYKSGYGF